MSQTSETVDDIERAFVEAGLPFSRRKLERWGAAGLLRREQTHPEGKRGSDTEYDPGTSQRAVDISRLLDVDRSFLSAGWLLWLKGYKVPDRYWRTRFKRVARAWDTTILKLQRQMDEDNPAFNEMLENIKRQDLPPHFRRSIPEDQIGTVLGIAASMLYGSFNTQLDETESDTFFKAMGLGKNVPQVIAGKSLQIDQAMSHLLDRIAGEISKANFSILARLTEIELEAARAEFLAAKIQQSVLYEKGKEILQTKNPFGLKLGVRLTEEGDHDAVAFCILMFAGLRRNTDAFVSPEKVARTTDLAMAIKTGSLLPSLGGPK